MCWINAGTHIHFTSLHATQQGVKVPGISTVEASQLQGDLRVQRQAHYHPGSQDTCGDPDAILEAAHKVVEAETLQTWLERLGRRPSPLENYVAKVLKQVGVPLLVNAACVVQATLCCVP